MAEILTAPPQKFVMGETVAWTQSSTDYPASAGWVQVTTFINSAAKFTVTAVASGDDQVSTIAINHTGLAAGVFAWQTKVTKDSIVHVLGQGTTEVVANFVTPTTLDTRSHAAKVLDAVEAVIEGRATEDHMSMSLAGRSIQKMSLAELLPVRDYYRREVAREQKAEAILAGRPPRGQVRTRYWV